SFYTLYEENISKLRNILEETSKGNHPKGSLEQKVGDYYLSGMDTAAINKIGGTPLKPMLDKIDAVKNIKELMELNMTNYAAGEGSLLGFYVGADDKNSAANIPVFTQSGMSLPEKGYYTRKDPATVAAREGLVKLISTFFELTGADKTTALKKANEQLALETEIATFHKLPVELRDPIANYNKRAVVDLDKNHPNIPFSLLFSKLNAKVDSVNVGQPNYFVGLNKLLMSKPLDVWKDKFKFAYINSNAHLLSKEFVDADFAFSKILSGQKEDNQRWKKMVSNVDEGMGDLLGQLYVKKYFTPTAKKRMDELVSNLQVAFEKRISNLDWMSDSTKVSAKSKLKAFLKKIGFPDKWKNFDDVSIDKANYFANAKNVELHSFKVMVNKIGKPVDRTEWGMSPPTVNAYYNPSNNEIVFPAGILQFPFFDADADDAINYGGIGMVIGHEMTHGFDDQGAQYDEKGNLKNWWKKDDETKFKAKTGSVAAQYNQFTVLDSLHVNGELTLGENLADIGGLAIAYDAFKMTKQGQGNEKIDGFTPDQRFFLGYAQVWRLVNRDETMRSRIMTDPHSPEMFRVNGPAMNFSPFYTAFDVKEGYKMYLAPEKRAKIW
ncbi:MAG: M13 family metallopeptidase, partial [Saprospiraceae bacterium]|nr:M13 family metallopeptidase [Saprospiraceae bacterium]